MFLVCQTLNNAMNFSNTDIVLFLDIVKLVQLLDPVRKRDCKQTFLCTSQCT